MTDYLQELTEEKKAELNFIYPNNLLWLRFLIDRLSGEYFANAKKVFDSEKKKTDKFNRLNGISNNLKFGCDVIDSVLEKRRAENTELTRSKLKAYDLQKTIDDRNTEIKRLKRQIEDLKKNINL